MANRRFIDFPIATTVGDNDIVLIWQDGANKQTTKATILSGLPENLEDLNDVVISGLTNGQILRYDSVTGKWENTDQGNLDLNDLNDVSIVSPSNGQVLVYNSSTSKWENSSGGFVPYTGAVTTVNLGAQTIQAGSFVKAGGTSSQFLKADGSIDSTAYGTGSVTSVGLTMPSAFNVANSPITTAGTLAVTGAGTVGQYIRGDGSLADFPQASGGGSSVSYYLNGSVNQGTIGGVAYKELSKVPILGAGTQFTINADGYIAQFLTDAGDPNLLEIPGGNWNFETYFSASSGGGSPTFYVELYKYDGTTFTLIASSSTSPEFIAFGTNLTPYYSTLAVPTTTLALTDRLAVRYYVTHSGRTITMHTENNTLCQIVTTFTTGLTSLNGLTAQVQNLAVGTSGTDFNIASATATHTFNLPTASATNRGALSSSDWNTFNNKQPAGNYVTTDTPQTISGEKTFTNSIILKNSSGLNGLVLSSFSPDRLQIGGVTYASQIIFPATSRTWNLPDATGTIALVGGSGVGTVTNVAALTLGTSGTDLSSSVANSTTTPVITLNVPTASATNRGALSAADWTTFNNKQNALTLTTTGTSGVATLVGSTLNIPNYGSALSGYVPYTGATSNVDLGIYTLSSSNLIANGGFNSGALFLKQSNNAQTINLNYTTITPIGTTQLNFGFSQSSGVWKSFVLNAINLTNNTNRTYTLPDADGTIALVGGAGVGTVTSVGLSSATSGVTIGSTPVTSSGTITLAIATASGSQQGLLSAADWTTFNNKQNALTNPVTGTGTTNRLAKFTGASTIGNSNISDGGITIFNENPFAGQFAWQFNGNTTTGLSFGASVVAGTNSSDIAFRVLNAAASSNYFVVRGDGNVGIGVTPSAWVDYRVLQLGGGSISSYVDNNFFEVNQNAFWNGSSYRYVNNGFASRYQQTASRHEWYNAPSGTAGNAISFTQAMTLTSDGNLLVGTASNAGFRMSINGPDGTSYVKFTSPSATTGGRIGYNGNEMRIDQQENANLIFRTNGSTHLTIASTGAATFSSSVTARGINTFLTGGFNDTTYALNASISSNASASSVAPVARFSNNGGGFVTKIMFSDNNRGDAYITHVAGSAFVPNSRWLGFGVDAVDQMIINASGNVGIGTASPSYQLTLNKALNPQIAFTTSDVLKAAITHITSDNSLRIFNNDGDKIMITSSGNVLIGTTTDNGARLQVSGNTNITNSSSDADLKIETTIANAGARLRLKTSTTEWFVYTNQTSSTLRFFNGDDRFILTNTGAATFSSTVTATSFITSSDLRLKEVIEKDGDLAVYKRKGEEQIHYGYIAQEMQESYPNQVHEAQDGYLSVNYVEILVKKVNELEKKIKQLEQ